MTHPDPGDPVRMWFRKWDGAPHWRWTMPYLGADRHGHWLGSLPGVEVARPGASYRTDAATAFLIPHDGYFLASVNDPASRIVIYVDITSKPEWQRDQDGWLVEAIDLDLDVVRTSDGRTWIDDEDEFAEHSVRYGYPENVITRTRATAEAVLAEVRAGDGPYGAEGQHWLDRLSPPAGT